MMAAVTAVATAPQPMPFHQGPPPFGFGIFFFFGIVSLLGLADDLRARRRRLQADARLRVVVALVPARITLVLSVVRPLDDDALGRRGGVVDLVDPPHDEDDRDDPWHDVRPPWVARGARLAASPT